MTIDQLLNHWRNVMASPSQVRRAEASKITFDDMEVFKTDAAGNPSESVNHDLMERVRVARDAAEAKGLTGNL